MRFLGYINLKNQLIILGMSRNNVSLIVVGYYVVYLGEPGSYIYTRLWSFSLQMFDINIIKTT